MASRIIGVDLGAHSVKVVITTPGLRTAQITDVIERHLPEGEEPHLLRAASVVGEILASYRGEDDSVYASIAGDKVFLHVLEFGFKSLKRADLERAVGAELEGVLPIDLEDMVYAFEQIPKLPDIAVAEEDGSEAQVARAVMPGRVAAPADGMRVLAAATQQSRAMEFLTALRAYQVEPHGLLAAPAPYARLLERICVYDGYSGPTAILDIGYLRSDFCVAEGGRPIFARSIARGGYHQSRAIARAWNLPPQQAEKSKISEGFVASSGNMAPTESAARMSEVLGQELSGLARELRRTLQACRAKTGFAPERIVLVGGGSRLRGLAAFLSEKLQLPVGLPSEDCNAKLMGNAASMASLDTCALALGIAMDGASARPSFNLRQGSLAFKGDLSFLRTKIPQIAAALVAVVAFGVLSAYAGVSKLRSAEKTLARRIALESAEAFGEQLSASDVLDRVGPVESGGKGFSPIPEMTGYDMLLAFNAALPGKDKAVLDVSDLTIEAGKVVIKATSSPTGDISALQGIKNLEESLKASQCFKDFSSPESQPAKDDARSFTLTIKSNCNKE